MGYLIHVDIRHSQFPHETDKVPRGLKHPRHLLIRHTNKAQGVEKRSTQEIIAMDLGTANLVPHARFDSFWVQSLRDFCVDARGLIGTIANSVKSAG